MNVWDILRTLRRRGTVTYYMSEVIETNNLEDALKRRTGVDFFTCDGYVSPFPEYAKAETLSGKYSESYCELSNYMKWVEHADAYGHSVRDAITYWNDEWWETEYLGEITSRCNGCGARYHIEDIDEDGYCESCTESNEVTEDSNGVHSYSAEIFDVLERKCWVNGKPTTTFGKHLLYGVELEIAGSQSGLARDLYDPDAPYILKYDGSVQGVELVTLPMDLYSHRKTFEWERTLQAARGEGTGRDSNCGIHIHINRPALSELVITKLVFFLNAAAHKDFNETVAQRKYYDNQYCRSSVSHLPLAKAKKEAQENNNRYVAVNLENASTIEIRIFQSNLRIERVMKNLEFVEALVRFCQKESLSKINPDSFIRFLLKYRKSYPNLFAFLGEKGLLPKPEATILQFPERPVPAKPMDPEELTDSKFDYMIRRVARINPQAAEYLMAHPNRIARPDEGCLLSAMNWSDTPQGSDLWHDIYDKMRPYNTLVAHVRVIDPDAAEYMLTKAIDIFDFEESDSLMYAFNWAATPRGHEYWYDLYSRTSSTSETTLAA